MVKRPPKSRAICFESIGLRQNTPPPPHPPVYAFKCLFPVSSEIKGKVVCNASGLSVSHLISCSTHYSDFSGQSSAIAVFLGFCSRLVFQFSSYYYYYYYYYYYCYYSMKSVTPDIQTPENVFNQLKISRQGTNV